MNRRIYALCLALVCLLSGCKGVKEDKKGLVIYTSFYAPYDLTKTICGDKAEVYNMVPAGTEPHDWEPTSKDMLSLNSADVVFYNGLGMEGWIDKAKENTKADFVCLSSFIGKEKEDPHIWLSPVNAVKMSEIITDTLSEKDSENASYYKENFEKFKTEALALTEEYKPLIAQKEKKQIVVSHAAYSYLCDDFGLEQLAVEGMSAESEPSPSKMKDIINFVKENDVKYIYYEESVSPKVAEVLSEEAGTELLPLNSFENSEEGKSYTTVMKENLENVLKGL
ncbi:MAG: zinc ABC transporter substrate-binding protein [Firmicutes bacterium]|nr:zinc ABC transporter substrate-binding protein [Bacillota bacterium]